jgi:hypothetical protein
VSPSTIYLRIAQGTFPKPVSDELKRAVMKATAWGNFGGSRQILNSKCFAGLIAYSCSSIPPAPMQTTSNTFCKLYEIGINCMRDSNQLVYRFSRTAKF